MDGQTSKSGKRADEPERRGGMVGGSTAVGDEGDIALGTMIAIALVIAVTVALIGATGGSIPGVGQAVPIASSEEEAADEGAPSTTVASAVEPADATFPADAIVAVSADGITLTGSVPDEATAQALYAQALSVFPADAIVDQLEIVEGAEPASLTLTGEAVGQTFVDLSTGFESVVPDPIVRFSNLMIQVEAPSASLGAVVTVNQGGVALTGSVPDEATAQALYDAALAVYPAERIGNELEVVDGAEPFVLTVTGETTDPVVFNQVTSAFETLGVDAGTFTNELVQVESSDVEAELNALDQILFQSGTSVILPESQAVVEAAAALMQANPDVAFEVGGHTDTRGGVEANQLLSEARATAVADALVGLGVTNELTFIGYGETRPIEANDTTDELQQANRRIEFRVL